MIFISTIYVPISIVILRTRIPLYDGVAINAVGESGDPLEVEYVTISDQVQLIPGKEFNATQEAIIRVPDVPAMGL